MAAFSQNDIGDDITFDILMDIGNLEDLGDIGENVHDWGGITDEDILAVFTNIEGNGDDKSKQPRETSAPVSEICEDQSDSEFATLTEADLLKIEEAKDEKSTKCSTNWGVRRLKEWCKARKLNDEFEKLPPAELSALLRRFYGEVRKLNGQEYSKNALAGIRSAIHRHLTSAPWHCKYNIMHDPEFKSANNVLVGTLKKMKKERKDMTNSYTPISSADLQKLMKSGVLSTDDPAKLQDLVWFSIQFYLCRRGCEGVNNLKKDSFLFHTDARGTSYVTLAYNEASKNHPGGFKNTNDPKKRMYATGGPLCPVNALKKYLGKLHPNSDALYQRPLEYTHAEGPWYQPIPLGIRRLQSMMSRLSAAAGLSMRYTNHCLRATAITNLMNCGFDPVTISRLSGHRNPASVSSYCRDVSDDTKCRMGGALTASLQPQQPNKSLASREVPTTSMPNYTISSCPSASSAIGTTQPSTTSTTSNSMISFSNRQALTSLFGGNCTVHIGSLNVYTQK